MAPTPSAFPARFDSDTWQVDLARATNAGQAAACTARRRYDNGGVPIGEVRRVQEEGPDGTILPQCVKVYLPPPSGRFGMVFEVTRVKARLRLEYLAFGVRHHPRNSNAPTVYQIAHKRLVCKDGTRTRRTRTRPRRR
jgi:hypothetical protein